MGDVSLDKLFSDHPRHWREHAYVYPVVSRRSKGVSIGVNLNPDTACNFDCIYCQVDRTGTPAVRRVDLDRLRTELDLMLGWVGDGALWREPPFDGVPAALRRVNDVAFSGDGEPTTYPKFAEAVRIVAEALGRHGLGAVKIVLITDASYLTKPAVREGLAIMDGHGGEIWAKLDAGTEAYYQLVNRPNFSLSHVIENIVDAARVRPVVIQSIWMRVHGEVPPGEEIEAFCDRLLEIVDAGGTLKLVQVYTTARQTAEDYVGALTDGELEGIAERVRERTHLPVETFPGIRQS
jgi:wyosine [tRNA(Phe)-imidazoG37] synthetase (radical SAM superfamily)